MRITVPSVRPNIFVRRARQLSRRAKKSNATQNAHSSPKYPRRASPQHLMSSRQNLVDITTIVQDCVHNDPDRCKSTKYAILALTQRFEPSLTEAPPRHDPAKKTWGVSDLTPCRNHQPKPTRSSLFTPQWVVQTMSSPRKALLLRILLTLSPDHARGVPRSDTPELDRTSAFRTSW